MNDERKLWIKMEKKRLKQENCLKLSKSRILGLFSCNFNTSFLKEGLILFNNF